MCGIMGYYCFTERRPEKNQITVMFELLESRGRDASGFAFIDDGRLMVHKAPLRSSSLVRSKEWRQLTLPGIFIAHTRMKTQGSEQNNKNNHPLYNKAGLCICHNGIIQNDSEIFAKNHRDGEVDSEAILAVLSSKGKGDKIKQVFDKLEGSFAFALIDRNNPERLVLVKKDNPVELYLDTRNDILYFCSERSIMQQSLEIRKQSCRGFNTGEGSFNHYTMENNHCLVVNPDGVESYKRYTAKLRRRSLWEGWGFNPADEEIVECPFCLESTPFHERFPRNECINCGSILREEDLYV